MNKYIVAPVSKTSARRAANNADQVEADAIRQDTAPIAACLTDDAIAYDKLPEEYDTATNPFGNPDWAEEDDARETAVGETICEIQRRLDYSGQQYPFELSSDNQFLSYKPERAQTRVYEFCLALSITRQSLTANPGCQAVREFERLVGRLLKSLLHPSVPKSSDDCAEWYRSGAPADGDRPTSMSSMLADLHEKTSEWRFSPSQGAEAQPEEGDDGIDVVVWKWFGSRDRRIGKPFLLAQCACGDDNYWFGKRHELDPDGFQKKWGGTISFAGLLRCLATPRHVPHPGVWLEGTSDGGILLDRIRLNWMAETCLHADEHTECKNRLGVQIKTLSTAPETKSGRSETTTGKRRKKR
jgi:hypothetical protein